MVAIFSSRITLSSLLWKKTWLSRNYQNCVSKVLLIVEWFIYHAGHSPSFLQQRVNNLNNLFPHRAQLIPRPNKRPILEEKFIKRAGLNKRHGLFKQPGFLNYRNRIFVTLFCDNRPEKIMCTFVIVRVTST